MVTEGLQKDGFSQSSFWLRVAALCVVTCGGFTVAASFAVIGAYTVFGIPAEAGFLFKTSVKGVFFALLTLAALGALRVMARRVRESDDVHASSTPVDMGFSARRGWIPLGTFVVFVVAAGMAFSNRAASPRAEPDETHHLIVARNLAVHGVYGSGHPDTGFLRFDQYDSVGPVVIGPVAFAMVIGGATLDSARGMMGLYFLGLAAAAMLLLSHVWRIEAGLFGVILLTVAPMTPYLSRTLYGEVPALLFFILALWAWRKAIKQHALGIGVFAGALFACSILSKSFMLLACFPIGAAVLYGWWFDARPHWKALAGPLAGLILVLGSWSLFKSMQEHDVSGSAADTIAVYQHNLMFGLGPLPQTMTLWWKHGFFSVLSLAGIVFTARRIFARPYDPSLAALWLWVVFLAFWWTFFTTGATPRYAWYAFACGALLAAPLFMEALVRAVVQRRAEWYAVCAALVFCAGATVVVRTAPDVRQLVGGDEMSGDYAVAEFVDNLPGDAQPAVSFWPLTRVSNFFANRSVPLAREGEPWDVLIAAPAAQNTVPLPDRAPDRLIGRYAIYDLRDIE